MVPVGVSQVTNATHVLPLTIGAARRDGKRYAMQRGRGSGVFEEALEPT